MHKEEMEIYSHTPNKVVLRVPWRRYPGILIQGDSLLRLKGRADKACSAFVARFRSVAPNEKEMEGMQAMRDLQDELRSLLSHYKRVTHWRRGSAQ
jgi:hypothetical protein